MVIIKCTLYSTGKKTFVLYDTATKCEKRWYPPKKLPANQMDQALYAAAEAFANETKCKLQVAESCSKLPTPDITLYDFMVGYWIPRRAMTVSKHTISSWNSFMKLRVGPRLGPVRLKDLTSLMLDDFFQGLSAEGLSIATIRKYQHFLNKPLKWAARHKIITANPLELIDEPERRADEEIDSVDRCTEEEIAAFEHIICTEPHRWKCLFSLLSDTGIRVGECVAIKWDDVDFEKKAITIQRTAGYTPEAGLYVKATKNTKTRQVDVAEWILNDLLILYRDRNKESDYLFPNRRHPNLPMTPSTPGHRLKKLCKKAGLRHIYPHLLRHSFASICITSGADVASVSMCLGHAKVSTTLDMYVSATYCDTKKAAAMRRETIKAIGEK